MNCNKNQYKVKFLKYKYLVFICTLTIRTNNVFEVLAFKFAIK